MQIIKLGLMKEMDRQKMLQKSSRRISVFVNYTTIKSMIKSIILSLVCFGVQITFKTRTYRSTNEQSKDCVHVEINALFKHLSNVGDKGSKSGLPRKHLTLYQ